MPLARPDGLGVVDDVATALNDHIIPREVTVRQRTASKRVTAPALIIQRVARVRGAAIEVSLAWYGFGFVVSNVIYRLIVATVGYRGQAQ